MKRLLFMIPLVLIGCSNESIRYVGIGEGYRSLHQVEKQSQPDGNVTYASRAIDQYTLRLAQPARSSPDAELELDYGDGNVLKARLQRRDRGKWLRGCPKGDPSYRREAYDIQGTVLVQGEAIENPIIVPGCGPGDEQTWIVSDGESECTVESKRPCIAFEPLSPAERVGSRTGAADASAGP